ncbi:hypothetical protein [Acinetobacter bohemicus]|uniref:hypothetical protein n=1 Tax=Acinetobacter bohemicus TaxID=1435036 RepID=UPI0040413DCA
MKKLIFTLIACLIILISLYFYLKPNNSQSIAELQKESVSNSSENSAEQSIQTSSNNTDMIAPLKLLKAFIEKAPFKQEDTHSILAQNPENIQNYLSEFSSLIDTNIMKNNKLSADQKAKILWSMFKEYNWLGDDNAFKAIIKDNLMYLRNPYLIPEIMKTYGDISSLGEKSANSRHDLLEIINSIDISPQNPNNKLVVDTLRSELRSINSRSEAQNLSDMATKILYEYGKSTGIDVIPDIIQAANTNTQASLSYVNNVLKLTLSDNNTTQLQSLIQSNMSQSTRDDLNKAISFNLKEDGNIAISSLNKESLAILDQYLGKEFSNNPEFEKNTELKQVYGKIKSVLE